MLDNQHPGGRYDDKELAEHTKTLRNTPHIKLPNLSKKEDYQAWLSEVPLPFENRLLDETTYGTERFDSVEGYKRPKYAEWYKARKVIDFSVLALSLSRITGHFEAGDGVNPDYLGRELMDRQLQPKEAVTKYVQDIVAMVRRLRLAKGEFVKWEHASLIISSTLLVLPDLARKYLLWIN
ncbi:hypothetical protein PC128_g17730 [Phytophthora cactorum]|nr:hypothetical protein PC128_g17730 [Phytophthora cactorum]